MKKKEKKLSEHKIKLIIMTVLTIAVVIAIPFIIKLIENINTTPPPPQAPLSPDNDDGDDTKITPNLVVPTCIDIDKLTTNHKFEYTVTDLGEYQITVTIQDTNIATVDTNNYIIPSAVGSTTIFTEINCEPKITKTTLLNITDVVTDISYKITDNNNVEPSKLFVGKTYTLAISENGNLSNPPNLGYLNEYISDFNFVSKTDNISTYKFKIIKAGDFNFYYNGKYCQKYINLTSYIFPTDINVSFSNITIEDNCASLYLFNITHAQQANANGYFNETTFEIIIDDDVYDDINYEITGTSIVIDGNKITAVSSGKASITFSSKISNINKTFEFDVKIIEPTSIILNDSTYNIGDQINFDLKLNTLSDFIITYTPIYAYGELTIETSDNITITNNKITLTNIDTGIAYIKFNGKTILTCNVNYIPDYKIDISIEQSTNEISISNNTLYFTLGDNNVFILNCKVINTSTNLPENIELEVEILDKAIVSGTASLDYVAIQYGNLTLIGLKSGNTKIIFTNDEFNIYYELKIEISD